MNTQSEVTLVLTNAERVASLSGANDNILLHSSAEAFLQDVKAKSPSNVIIDGDYLHTLFTNPSDALEATTMVKRLARTRIIYFTPEPLNDNVVKYLISIGEYDINEVTEETEINIDYLNSIIENFKQLQDALVYEHIESVDKDEYIETAGLFDSIIEFIAKEDHDGLIHAISSNRKGIEKANTLLRTLQASNTELEKKEMTCRISLKAMTDKNYELIKDINDKTEKINELSKKVSDLAARLNDNTNGLLQLKEQNEKLSAELELSYQKMKKVAPVYDFVEVNLNRLQVVSNSLDAVVYIKEYSYPLYFNSLLMGFFDYFTKQGVKVKLAVYEDPQNKLRLKTYEGFFRVTSEMAETGKGFMGQPKLLITEPRTIVTETLFGNSDDSKMLIILDRTGSDKEIVIGSGKLDLKAVKSKSDALVHRLPFSECISSSMPEAGFNIPVIDSYRDVQTPLVREKLLKSKVVLPFLNFIKSM